jgi:hypothetical protein
MQKKAGIDLDSPANGVSIRETYHRKIGGVGGDTNTLQKWYYEELVDRFNGIEHKDDFIRELDNFANWLLIKSEKIK